MLYLAFLWHMHQPWYLDPATGRFALPWVRLHGTKDYLDMPELIQEFPKVRATFNLTACLLQQIERYGQGGKDEHQLLCEKPAEDLTPAEVGRLFETGPLGNPPRMIHPYPRYYELMAKQQRRQTLLAQEIRDLQVWSNLAWMDPRWRRQEPFLGSLVKKGSRFTEEEKEGLLKLQLKLLARIVPTYRALQEAHQLELTTSAWAHPILPLLSDSQVAGKTNPGMPLPLEPFHFPEDAAWHLSWAFKEHARFFGESPRGLWPPEGALSESVLAAIAEAGFQWVATDEGLLWKSLASGKRPDLYQPYRIRREEGDLTLLFRDQLLSDRIGFVYSGWPVSQAVADFLKALKAIEKESSFPFVLVALDGENPWEFYSEDGEPFLRALYEAVSEDQGLQCVTISEYLQQHPPKKELDLLAPGSWIRGEFSTWIGHPPQNRAWEELLKARRIKGPQGSKAIAVAEGSDWFWWLGPEHSSPQDRIFDRLFRSHLRSVYQESGSVAPVSLEEPLKGEVVRPVVDPTGPITPVLDGEVTSYFEWLPAGEVDLTVTSLAMARAWSLFSRLWWGRDSSHVYLRLDPARPLSGMSFKMKISEPRFQVILVWEQGAVRAAQEIAVAVGRIVELAIPLGLLTGGPGESLALAISIEQEGGTLERYPEQGSWTLTLPALTTATGFWSA